jgi:hypothetical protein
VSARASLAAAVLLFAAPSASAQVKADANHVYGPDPGWAKFREIGEQAVIARLVDPESARVSWMSGYRKGGFKPMFERRVHGYVACGTVNARNRMGGYAGATGFIVVVDFDRALRVEMDSRSGGMYGEMCAKQVREGKFPALPADEAAASSSADADRAGSSRAASALGLTVRTMPEGAYVSAVEAGSPAGTAGLTPGMVVTAVNGIPLAGMGDAMTKVLAAAGSGSTLTLVGGKTVTLGAPK